MHIILFHDLFDTICYSTNIYIYIFVNSILVPALIYYYLAFYSLLHESWIFFDHENCFNLEWVNHEYFNAEGLNLALAVFYGLYWPGPGFLFNLIII